jgi:hypothetical protein
MNVFRVGGFTATVKAIRPGGIGALAGYLVGRTRANGASPALSGLTVRPTRARFISRPAESAAASTPGAWTIRMPDPAR